MEKPPRSPTEGLVSPWTFVRWMVVGFYVGFATVAAFAFWYMFDNVLGIDLSQDGHTTITWHQLTHYSQCNEWDGFKVHICPRLSGCWHRLLVLEYMFSLAHMLQHTAIGTSCAALL